jgi:ferredoxin
MGTLDIRNPEFWELGAVDKELRRVYDICGGCRRCLPLCPSFKVLFDRMDVDAVDGDVDKLPAADVKEVVDLCYQCKLCFNHCPYTPPHRWEVDFPRLMLRARAAQARRSGVSLQDRALGNADLVGKLGSLTAPLSNWMNELGVHRAFMQAVMGIHKLRKPAEVRAPDVLLVVQVACAHGAARAGGCGDGALAQGRAVRDVQRRVLRDGDGTGRGARARAQPVDVSLPEQRCCGHAVSRRRRDGPGKALIRENVASLAPRSRGARDRRARTDVQLHAQAGIPVARRLDDAKLVAANTRTSSSTSRSSTPPASSTRTSPSRSAP